MSQLMKQPATPTSWQAGRDSGRSKAAVLDRQTNCSTFCNALGQVVGRLESGWLVKHVDTRRHQLRVPPAWACDVAHIEQLRQCGAHGVKLIDERGRIWTAPLGRWQGLRTIDRGHGRQYVLPLDRWTVEDPTAQQLRLLEVVP